MAKLGRLSTRGIEDVVFADQYRRERIGWLRWRLVAAPAADPIALLREIVLESWPPPYRLLYVLHVSRTNREPGRYELATPLDAAGLTAFLDRYRAFLERDSRHDLWVTSRRWINTRFAHQIVYDHHDILFLYGNILRLEWKLRARGFGRGPLGIPQPHVHRYEPEFDEAEEELLTASFWRFTPLQDDD